MKSREEELVNDNTLSLETHIVIEWFSARWGVPVTKKLKMEQISLIFI